MQRVCSKDTARFLRASVWKFGVGELTGENTCFHFPSKIEFLEGSSDRGGGTGMWWTI
jgi:hypothetical protein